MRLAAVLIDGQDGSLGRARWFERVECLSAHQRCWPELLNIRDSLDLAWSARDAGFFAETMHARAFPSYRSRFEVRARTLALFQGRDESNRLGAAALRRNWAINRGAQVKQLDRVFASELALSSTSALPTRLCGWCQSRK